MDRYVLAAAVLALASCGQMKSASLHRVDDRANLLSPDAEKRIASELGQLEMATTDQVQVMTVPSLGGKPIEQVALQTANSEGLGVRGKDNGVLVLVAPTEHQVRIETGRGIVNVLTDPEAENIIQSSMIPHFQAGRLGAGIEAGVKQIDLELRKNPERPPSSRKD